jgi:pilus assembly protein Flp/PilA
MNTIARFANDESGATAIEYGLIAALVSVAIIVALQTLATNLNTTFNKVSSAMSTANK